MGPSLLLLIGVNLRRRPTNLLTKSEKESFTILKQVYRAIAHTVQGAFKDLMTHRFMQIALLFAFHCVLHRCKSQEIHC